MAFLQTLSAAGTTPLTVTLSGVVANSTLIAHAVDGSTTAPGTHTVADGQGSYTQQGSAQTVTADTTWAAQYALIGANAGSHGVVFTLTAGNTVGGSVTELTGPSTNSIPASGFNGAAQVSPGTATDALSSGSCSTTGSATLLGAIYDTHSLAASDEPATGTGFTSRDANVLSGVGAYRIETQSVSGAAPATATAITGTDNFITFGIMVLEPGGGGGGTVLMGQACL